MGTCGNTMFSVLIIRYTDIAGVYGICVHESVSLLEQSCLFHLIKLRSMTATQSCRGKKALVLSIVTSLMSLSTVGS